ncbi:hypothetical protein JXL21_14585 [Candidatus Bathyarchaeota archaeon]|nr:hypothetical protein [Candidatus Bathyarchaeota archaeon]
METEKTGRDYAANLLQGLNVDISDLDNALNSFEDKLNNLENRVSSLEGKIDEIEKSMEVK